jgi:hypothetical protein
MDLSQALAPLAGGALIGVSASWLLATHGKIAGISGIFSGTFEPHVPDRRFRVAFLTGLVVAGMALSLAWPGAFGSSGAGLGVIALAGLLVGVGTRLGNGCTSGHGVCGLSRMSPRSLVATLTFIATGAVTVAAVRMIGGG